MKNRFLLVFAIAMLLMPSQLFVAAAAVDEADQIMDFSQPTPIITDEIGRNPQTGDIMIELDVDALPQGTVSLQLRSGDVILLDGLSGVVLLEMSPGELNSNGELSLTALDGGGAVLASYTMQIADRLPAASMSTVSLVLLITASIVVFACMTIVGIRLRKTKTKDMQV